MINDYANEEAIQESFDKAIIKKLYMYLKPQLLLFILCLLLIVATTAIDLSIPYFIKVSIDDYIIGHNKVMLVHDTPMGGDSIHFNNSYYERTDLDDLAVIAQTYPNKQLAQLHIIDQQAYLLTPTTESQLLKAQDQNRYAHYVKSTGKALSEESYQLFRSRDKSNLFKIALMLVGLLLMNFLLGFANMLALNYGSQKIIFALRSDLYGHIQKQSLSFLIKIL